MKLIQEFEGFFFFCVEDTYTDFFLNYCTSLYSYWCCWTWNGKRAVRLTAFARPVVWDIWGSWMNDARSITHPCWVDRTHSQKPGTKFEFLLKIPSACLGRPWILLLYALYTTPFFFCGNTYSSQQYTGLYLVSFFPTLEVHASRRDVKELLSWRHVHRIRTKALCFGLFPFASSRIIVSIRVGSRTTRNRVNLFPSRWWTLIDLGYKWRSI